MRPPGLADMDLLARVLMSKPPEQRQSFARQIIAEVKAAAGHLRVSGRSHPQFGDGSLMARCLSLPLVPEQSASEGDFLSAMIAACQAVREHSIW